VLYSKENNMSEENTILSDEEMQAQLDSYIKRLEEMKNTSAVPERNTQKEGLVLSTFNEVVRTPVEKNIGSTSGMSSKVVHDYRDVVETVATREAIEKQKESKFNQDLTDHLPLSDEEHEKHEEFSE
jgi:hypothetical protein